MPNTRSTSDDDQPLAGGYEIPPGGAADVPESGGANPSASTLGAYETSAYGVDPVQAPLPDQSARATPVSGVGGYNASSTAEGFPPAGTPKTQTVPHGAAYPGAELRPKPVDYVIGGSSILRSLVANWQDSGAPTLEEARQVLEHEHPVLLPESQWEAFYGPLQGSRARYAAIGLALSAAEEARESSGWIRSKADTIADRVFAPIYHSWLMGPVRRRVDRLAEAGEAKIDEWAAIGRAREQHSVLLTQASVQRLAGETMEFINEGPIVREVVQEVVRAQGQSLTLSFLDELREHAVTLDLALEHRIRRVLGRPAYPTHASPEYQVALRGQSFDLSLLGERPFLGGQFAGFVSRSAAFAIDIFLVAAALTFASMFYTALRDIFFIDRFFNALVGADTMNTIRAIVAGLAAFVVAAGYWLVSWAVTGETIGHAIMGVRVIHRDGKRLNIWQALRRLFGYFVSAIPFGLGFLWVLIDNRRDGWHDKIASSDAVYVWQARPDESFLSREVAQIYRAEQVQNAPQP